VIEGIAQPNESGNQEIGKGKFQIADFKSQIESIQALGALLNKSGFKTSEFALLASISLGVLLLALAHVVSGELAAICSTGAALIFTQIRTQHKNGIIDTLTDALQGAQVVSEPATVAGLGKAVEQIVKPAAAASIGNLKSQIENPPSPPQTT
jgi:hypothetical protein